MSFRLIVNFELSFCNLQFDFTIMPKKLLTPQQLKTLKKVFKKFKVEIAYIFGSQVKGKVNKLSDYDFAVLFSKEVPKNKYFDYKVRIISELLRLVETDHVDLVVLNNPKTPLLLKYNIIKEGKVIYSKDDKKRAQLEFNILRRWLDWQYFEKMWADLYTSQVAKGKI